MMSECTEQALECVRVPEEDDAFLRWAREEGGGVTNVDLSRCGKLTDVSLQVLAEDCHHIRVLDLDETSFSEAVILQLLEALPPQLEAISLSRCRITDATLLKIAERHLGIRWLSTSFTSGVTEIGVNAILRRCYRLTYFGTLGCTLCSNRSDGIAKHNEVLGVTQENHRRIESFGVLREYMAGHRIHRFWRDVCYNPAYAHARERLLA